jgi:hypothetical protein
MTSGQCPHPWNKGKKGTFQRGHSQVNRGKGQFQKGHSLTDKEAARKRALKNYESGNSLRVINVRSQAFGNKDEWYGLGKAKWRSLSQKIRRRDAGICQSCGVIPDKHNCHHIIPYSVSKDNREENLVTLCIPCHTSIEYYTKLQYAKGGTI